MWKYTIEECALGAEIFATEKSMICARIPLIRQFLAIFHPNEEYEDASPEPSYDIWGIPDMLPALTYLGFPVSSPLDRAIETRRASAELLSSSCRHNCYQVITSSSMPLASFYRLPISWTFKVGLKPDMEEPMRLRISALENGVNCQLTV